MSAMTVNVTLEAYLQDVPLSAQVNVQPNRLYTTAMKRDLSMHSNEVKGSSPANEQRASKGGSHEASSNPDHITCDRPFISYPFGSQQLQRHDADATGPSNLLCIAGSKHSIKKTPAIKYIQLYALNTKCLTWKWLRQNMFLFKQIAIICLFNYTKQKKGITVSTISI